MEVYERKEIFIGRKSIIDRLNRQVFRLSAKSLGRCFSLVGPNDVGKTMLIAHMAEQLKENPIPNVYYFKTDIIDGMTYWSFWIRLIQDFSREIPEEKLRKVPKPDAFHIDELLDAYDFFNDEENLEKVGTPAFENDAIVYLNQLFVHYKALGIRIIITIDEFDRARKVFTDGAFFQRLFLLTPKGGSNLLLSIITISRRSVSTIAHHMQEGSNFEDAYPRLPLRGFTNKELETYFATYEELDCGVPSKEQQQQILYLCGRSPGLLMKMRQELELLYDEPINIARIHRENGSFVRTAYNRMCDLMNGEFVDQQKSQPCMSVFIQRFIGPAYSEELASKVQVLYDLGFVTCTSTTDDIFVMSGLRSPRENASEDDVVYEPLSPYFVDYVKHTHISDDMNNLAGLLEKTERTLRNVLSHVLQTHYPDNWDVVLDTDIPQKDNYVNNLRMLALRNDMEERSLVVSKLDVLAFFEYYIIIKKHWDITKEYFKKFDDLEEVGHVCQFLNDCRNSSAHLNLEVLNNENRRRLRIECERMLSSMNKEDGDTEEWIGREVMMTEIEVTARGGIRGKLSEGDYYVAISPRHLDDNAVSASYFVGKNVRVKLTRWDDNAQKFNAELV